MNLPLAATLRRSRVSTVTPKRCASLRRPAATLDGGEAFVRDFRSGRTPIRDGDTEAFGEVFVWAITSNDAMGELASDEVHVGALRQPSFDLEDQEEDEPLDLSVIDAPPTRAMASP